MDRTPQSHTLRTRSQEPRGGRVRSRAGRPGWSRPLRRARQAIDASLRLIDSAYLALEVAEHAPLGRPMVRATRQLLLLPRWMDQAHERLTRALRLLREAKGCLDLASASADGAELRMLDQAERTVDGLAERLSGALTRLSALSHDTEEAFGRLAAMLAEAAAVVARSAECAEADGEQPPVVSPKPNRLRYLRCRRSGVSDRLRSLGRRRRSPSRVDGAARRVSRGRAPPAVSICQP